MRCEPPVIGGCWARRRVRGEVGRGGWGSGLGCVLNVCVRAGARWDRCDGWLSVVAIVRLVGGVLRWVW